MSSIEITDYEASLIKALGKPTCAICNKPVDELTIHRTIGFIDMLVFAAHCHGAIDYVQLALVGIVPLDLHAKHPLEGLKLHGIAFAPKSLDIK